MKNRKRFLGVFAFAAAFMMGLSAVGLTNAESKVEEVRATQEPETDLDLMVVGTGVKWTKYADHWNTEGGVSLNETSPGVYTGAFYSEYSGFTIIEKGTWSGKRYGYNELENPVMSPELTLVSDDDGKNIFNPGHWGYFVVTVDTTKDSKPLSLSFIGMRAPMVIGNGISGGAWDTNSEDFIMQTTDGVHFSILVETVVESSNAFRIKGWSHDDNDWTYNYACYDQLDSSCPVYGDFSSEGNDHNIKPTKAAPYLIEYTHNSTSDMTQNSVYIKGAYQVTYKYRETTLDTEAASLTDEYTAKNIPGSEIDANKRFYGWYTDAGLTTPYVAHVLTDDLILYGDYRDYSNTVYYAPGRDYNWAGAYIYAWDANGAIVGAYPGTAMTACGAGIYSYTFVGEQEPLHYIFSETGNDGNKTPDLNAYPTGKNIYIYRVAREVEDPEPYQFIDEDMINAERFGEAFLNGTDSGCNAKSFDNESWSTLETNLAEYLNNPDTLATFLANNGVFKAAGLTGEHDDYIDEALRRYADIHSKYSVNDFLHLYPSNNVRIGFSQNTNNSSFAVLFVCGSVLFGMIAITLLIVKKKSKQD